MSPPPTISEPLSLPQWTSPTSPTSSTPPAAPDSIRDLGVLHDSHGRVVRDLRISLTDRCNFRCVYCMEPDVRFAPTPELLSPEEFVRLGTVAATLGIRRIRLTGGEPTLHPALREIASALRCRTGCEIALTTNGSRGNAAAVAEWRRSGIDRVTISLDSLRDERFRRMTRSTASVGGVLECIEHCVAEGLAPVKVNVVTIHGENDDEIVDFARLARRLGIEVRFIEWMPLDSGRTWTSQRWVSAAEIHRTIDAVHPLVAEAVGDPSATATRWRFADGGPGRIGLVAPISSPFCGACSRLRLTADGKIRPCLFGDTEWDVRPLLRGGADDEALRGFLVDAVWSKQSGHGIESPEFRPPRRPMSAIGG